MPGIAAVGAMLVFTAWGPLSTTQMVTVPFQDAPACRRAAALVEQDAGSRSGAFCLDTGPVGMTVAPVVLVIANGYRARGGWVPFSDRAGCVASARVLERATDPLRGLCLDTGSGGRP